MYITILGRQPEISIAELGRICSSPVDRYSLSSATFEMKDFSIDDVGGVIKAATVLLKIPNSSPDKNKREIVDYLTKSYQNFEGKLTIGISAYDFDIRPYEVQKIGLEVKLALKKRGVSVRLIPNQTSALSTATSHHNKLGLSDNKLEIIIIKGSDNSLMIGNSIGTQNITSYSKRDYNRPKRDAFVGMLPPKLAQIMVNLACRNSKEPLNILDPFCGSGVILQEASLKHYNVQGTDLSDKMISYSIQNLDWFAINWRIAVNSNIYVSDATKAKWQQPVDAVVSEIYLGQPFSAPPSDVKLKEVSQTCNSILRAFLKNIAPQLKPSTPLCLAIPAWQNKSNQLSFLPIQHSIEKLGYRQISLGENLVYQRPGQIVARELLLLEKI